MAGCHGSQFEPLGRGQHYLAEWTGQLFYTGGEDGRYIRIRPDSTMGIDTYEGAFPHICKALFQKQAECHYFDFERAFEAACQLGGEQFYTDIVSLEPEVRLREMDTGPKMMM